jgi:hypothetical protein
MKLVRLIKMCVNETYSRVRGGKYLCDIFSIRNCLKQGDALLPFFFLFLLQNTPLGGFRKPGWLEIKWYTSALDSS